MRHPSADLAVAGLILAAGASSRIGAPKALLPFNDRTFVENLAGIFHDAGLAPIVVVLSHDRQEILAKLPPFAAAAINQRPEGGQISSLRVGLGALSARGRAVLVGLVDQPTVAPETVSRLLEAWRASRAHAVVPRYLGERGHPVLLSRALYPAIFRAGGGATLRDVLEENAEDVVDLDLDDPRVLLNVNNPADYRRLLELYGQPHEKHLGDPWHGYLAAKSRSGRE